MSDRYDLHTHTVVSDGTTTPEENVQLALDAGLGGIAVTDHDTMDGVERARAAADGTGLEIIPGTEFSAELDGASVHVLGFWTDPAYAPLADEMDRLRNERYRRAEQIVEKFNAMDVPVTFARVQELAGDAPIGRPHIARAVEETGAAEYREVFDRWLADGGPAYVPKHAVSPVEAVKLLMASGGVAVLAHPGLYGRDDAGLDRETIEAMAAAGMIGIEADHPDHSDADRELYNRIARDLGLIVTAGSDFHGESKNQRLGDATAARSVIEALREGRS